MKSLFISIFFISGLCIAQGYEVVEGNPIWVTENYQTEELGPYGDIVNAGEAYSAESDLQENPLDNTTAYHFDYKIAEHITMPDFDGYMTYYVNSNDGSIAIPINEENQDIQTKLNSAYSRGGSKWHFIIRKANGNFLGCGLYENEKTGDLEKRGIDLGKDKSLNAVFGNLIWEQQVWLNSAEPFSSDDIGSTTPALIEIIENVPIEAKRGKVPNNTGTADNIVDLYSVKYPVMEHTSIPFMGLGVGIMKNFNLNINQLIIYGVSRENGGEEVYFHLESLYKANAVFHPEQYTITTIMNKEGMEDSKNFQQEAMQMAVEIQRLSQQKSECPDGDSGSECRSEIDKRIRDIEKELRDKAKELGEKHNVPME